MANADHRIETSVVSPLRYPGAKRRFSGYIAEVIRLNGLKPKLFVEPFAGGASVALNLLHDGVVESIALADKDPLVSSFFKVVFTDCQWLINKVKATTVTLKKWDFYREQEHTSDRTRAFACLFLNRTSFSGILAPSAGPIGGREQESDYCINCRFPVDTLVKRIERISALSDKVKFVKHADWQETIKLTEQLGYKKNDVFYYLDPPFYKKAERLYRFYFDDDEQRALKKALGTLKQPWLLSYDPAQEIATMYSSNGYSKKVDLLYSASGKNGRGAAKELIITNLEMLPTATRLWKSSNEWKGLDQRSKRLSSKKKSAK